jgi:hypothetical protein
MMNVNCFGEYVPNDVQTNIYLKVSLSDVKHSFYLIKNVGNLVRKGCSPCFRGMLLEGEKYLKK